MRYDLVIFDNDGVLVDSEPISNRILSEYLTDLGHPTSYDECVRDFMGGSVGRVEELILERTGRPLPAEFGDVLHQRVVTAFQEELCAIAGVVTVLEKLAADGVPHCVASSGTHDRIRAALHRTALYPHFGEERIFSVQDVSRGKPEPDLFLHAARTMGVAPDRCVVVEDSPLGVRAARAAGMTVYGYCAMTPEDRLAEATGLFRDMGELLGLLH